MMDENEVLNKKNDDGQQLETVLVQQNPEQAVAQDVTQSAEAAPETKKVIPKVLEERLLITPEHRKILNAVDSLSPVDLGWIYLPGNALDRFVPSEGMIAQEIGMDSQQVLNGIQEIKKIWKIPNDLPTNNGRLSPMDALIHALTIQHRLRWDPEINDYRIPRWHVLNGELGTGKLYTNNDAFIGERIFRNALGINEMLNDYQIQGGIMPDMIKMYGKRKNQRALLTGLNKTGKLPSASELERIKKQLELAHGKSLDEKQISNLRKFVVNTIDTMEEAARSVAHELVPLVKDIPSYVPIHMYCSFNDDSNMSEIEDTLIAAMIKLHSKAKEAQSKLPKLRKDVSAYKLRLAKSLVSVGVADYLLDAISDIQDEQGANGAAKGTEKKTKFTGKALRDKLKELVDDETNGKPALKRLSTSLKKKYFKQMEREDEDGFARAWDDAKARYTASVLSNVSDLELRRRTDGVNKESLEEKLESAEDDIDELSKYEDAITTELQEGHAWFTKKTAIKPTEAKANLMIEKMQYTALYQEILIPHLKELVGRELNINLHTDREKSVFIKDPTALLGMNSYPNNKLYGTIFYSIPRVNRQRSNEPLLDSLAEAEKKHEGAIKTMLKKKMPKPKTVEQFDKRHSAAFANVVMTSWGADGYRLQPKFVVAPTEVRGEFQLNPETVWYLKLPTRHDATELAELHHKGNTGTWEIKRLDKGGPTAGNVIMKVNPDQSQEWTFVDDIYYASLATKYGAKISALENNIAKARIEGDKKPFREELEKIYAEIRPEINYIMLANDLHLGSFNLQGRPTNIDYIRASQIVALQDLGIDPKVGPLKMFQQTEALHGRMRIRSHGYDSTMEGQEHDPLTSKIKIDALRKKLKDQGMNERKILEHIMAYADEQNSSRSVFRPQDQKEMYKLFQQPLLIELMDNGGQVAVGDGNHWTQSMGTDEAGEIRSMFDLRYVYTDKLICSDTGYGQSYSYDRIILPGTKPDVELRALVTHKMWHGRTEISSLADQAIGHKEDVFLYITADRHHPGVVAEKDVYVVLDVGKQSTMAHVSTIGKCSSVRGTMAVGYGSRGELMLPVRFWLDPIVETVIGWSERRKILKTNWDSAKSEMKNYFTQHKY